MSGLRLVELVSHVSNLNTPHIMFCSISNSDLVTARTRENVTILIYIYFNCILLPMTRYSLLFRLELLGDA